MKAKTIPLWRLCATALAGLALATTPAAAQITGNVPTVRNVAFGPMPSFNQTIEPIVLMTQDDLDNFRLVARLMERSTGDPVGLDVTAALPDGVTPVDMIWSRIIRPGSLLVLDTNFFVRQFLVSYDANNQIVLTAPPSGTGVFGPYGVPPGPGGPGDGAPTSLVEVPGFFLAIGTTTRNLILDDGSGTVTVNPIARGPIVDLAVVPQVGYFAIVMLVIEKLPGDSKIVGVHPDGDPSTPAAQPVVFFNLLAEPRPDPHFVTLAGAAFEPTDSPLTDPAEVNLIASNNQAVFRVTIPASPTLGGTATVSILELRPIIQFALGSLAMVPADGSGVLYDPGFNLNQGGISGTLLTIFGSSAQVSPATLNLSSPGQFITAVIEVAGGLATEIDATSVMLEVNGGSVRVSGDFAPRFGDDDKDGNADLKVKFDRTAVQALIPTGVSPALMTLRWNFSDGSSGRASVQVRIVQ